MCLYDDWVSDWVVKLFIYIFNFFVFIGGSVFCYWVYLIRCVFLGVWVFIIYIFIYLIVEWVSEFDRWLVMIWYWVFGWLFGWMVGWFIYSDVLSVDSVADWYMKKFSFLILWKSKIWQQKKNGIFYHTFLIQKIYRGSKYFHEISFLPQMLNNGYYLMFFWQPKGAIFTQNA